MGAKKPEFKETCCIINPNSANQKWKRNRFYRKNFKRIFPVQIIDDRKDKEHTIKTATELCKDYKVIVAAGGDGTIADVMQGIMRREEGLDVTLGIIPMGSGNAFRKSFRISKNLQRSVNLIAKGKSRSIDLIEIEGKVAAFGSVGATAQATIEKKKGKIPGFFGHFFTLVKILSMPRRRMEIELFDGVDDQAQHFDYKKLELKVFDCVIGKTKHFGYGWRVAPQAKIDDGYIDITLFETSGLQYIAFFPAIFLGLYQRTQKHFKAKKVLLRGNQLPIQYHGELMGIKDEIKMKVIPDAVNIICPEKMKW